MLMKKFESLGRSLSKNEQKEIVGGRRQTPDMHSWGGCAGWTCCEQYVAVEYYCTDCGVEVLCKVNVPQQ